MHVIQCVQAAVSASLWNVYCTGDCGDPGNVANGLRTISGTTEGHRVTYSCSAGYRLVGDAVRTCMPASGQWSGTQPNCSGMYQLSCNCNGALWIWLNMINLHSSI